MSNNGWGKLPQGYKPKKPEIPTNLKKQLQPTKKPFFQFYCNTQLPDLPGAFLTGIDLNENGKHFTLTAIHIRKPQHFLLFRVYLLGFTFKVELGYKG
jgi:hypothetical protein